MMRRVVVTGMGVVSPLGNNIGKFWQNISAGKSGISKVTRFDTNEFSTKIAGEVKNFESEGIIEKKEIRRMDLFCQYALVAADQAIKQAKLNINKYSERTGVIIGCGIGGFQTIENQYRNLLEKGPTKVSPFTIPMIIPNMAAGQIAIKYGVRGPNFCSVTACASGANAIGDAFRLIKNNEADIIICGGTEAPITPLGFAGFCSARAMSKRNDEPEKACRPFNLDRDGFVMGEGAGVIILEEENHARAREVEILGEISGYGSNGDAYHITAPEPEGTGVKNAMLLALRDSGLNPYDIDYINAHGTSTPANDKTETAAIKKYLNRTKFLSVQQNQ